jgi:hypothetical protein
MATGLWKSENMLAGAQPLFRVAGSFCAKSRLVGERLILVGERLIKSGWQ